jgi:hypothetical protein
MKIINIVAFGCLSVAKATNDHDEIMNLAALPLVKSFQKNRALAVISETCENEIIRIEGDADLEKSFDSIMQYWDEDFAANSTDFCFSTSDGKRTAMDCAVDFTAYEGGYETQCTNIEGGKFYPLTVLMKCADDTLSFYLEMGKIPSCFGNRCDVGELYLALSSVLDGIEEDVDTESLGLSCEFFLDYGSLKDAPERIDSPIIGPPSHIGSGTQQNALVNTSLKIVVGGITLFLFLW